MAVVASSLAWHRIAIYSWNYYFLCVVECKLQSQEVCLLIFEKHESSSCGRKIAGREVKLEMVNPNQNRWIY